MYTFYKDKTELFECNINVEGASLKDAKSRLILENDEYNLIFDGTIDENGKCSIPVKKLKVLSENLKGKLILEVIVENDVYFSPYIDDFIVDVNKKMTVEVIDNKNKQIIKDKKVIVEMKKNPTPKTSKIIDEIMDMFKTKNITIFNIKDSKTLPKIISETINKYNLDINSIKIIQKNLLTKLISEPK